MDPVAICMISASSMMFWEASVTAEPYVPMTAITPAEASFWAAREAVRGSPASSSTISSICLPLMPPALFTSETSRLTICCMSWPSLAHLPVSGHIRPMRIASAAKEGPAASMSMAATSISFFTSLFMLSPEKWNVFRMGRRGGTAGALLFRKKQTASRMVPSIYRTTK